jgi:hypothetical protein
MIDEKELSKLHAPTKGKLAKATIVAAGIAAVLLFTIILPAEYGYDPLGTGAALGLTALSDAASNDAAQTPVAPVVARTFEEQPAIFKTHAEDMVLHPGRGVEVKYHMQKGAVLVYSWKANGKLLYEFHGEPDQKPNPDYYDSYELDDKVGKDHSYGFFTAPSTGIHGWFWENKGEEPVEFRLTSAGFYDAAKMFAGGDPIDLEIQDAK